VDEYCLEVGTTAAGANDVFSGYTTDTSQQVTGLPIDHCPVYVRLWSRVPGHPTVWLYNDCQYDSYNICGEQWIYISDWYESGSSIDTVAHDGSKFVTLGSSGHVHQSTDGIIWTRGTPLPSNVRYYGMVYAQGKFVGVGGQGKTAVSTNGNSWSTSTTPVGINLYSVTYDPCNDLFVAVGDNNSVSVSSDGSMWTSYYLPLPGQMKKTIWAVTCADGKFVSVGSYGLVATSTDGYNWSIQQIDFNQHYFVVTYGDGIFVAAGHRNNGCYITSTNGGTTWTQRSWSHNSVEFWNATYTGSHFVIVGESPAAGQPCIILTSTDPLLSSLWQNQVSNAPPPALVGVCYGREDEKIIAVGGNDVIVYNSCPLLCTP
jgi:photosystem II stability/assembly factor-like uncharacterized protein